MLTVNLRHLDAHAVRLSGELSPAELDFGLNDRMIRAERPLKYDLTVEKLNDALLVSGWLRLVLDCECVRCLKPFRQRVELPHWAVHLPLSGEDRVSLENDCADLTPYVREDMLLEFPRHPLCKAECEGLKPGKARKAGGPSEAKSSAWAELDKLKL